MPVRLLQDFEIDRAIDRDYVVRSIAWDILIPRVHRILADPDEVVTFPRPTRATAHEVSQAYWETAAYIACFLLGWQDPGKAFQQMLDVGPWDEDARVRLLREVWDSDGQLDLLAAYFWSRDPCGYPARLAEHVLRADAQAKVASAGGRPIDEFGGRDWNRRLLERFPGFAIVYAQDPYHGGSNPLHLGQLGLAEPTNELWLHSVPAERRAVCVVDTAREWPLALYKGAAALPELEDRSWRVEVFSRRDGFIGEFCRSSESGFWFQGRHTVHAIGCMGDRRR